MDRQTYTRFKVLLITLYRFLTTWGVVLYSNPLCYLACLFVLELLCICNGRPSFCCFLAPSYWPWGNRRSGCPNASAQFPSPELCRTTYLVRFNHFISLYVSWKEVDHRMSEFLSWHVFDRWIQSFHRTHHDFRRLQVRRIRFCHTGWLI